MGGGHEVVEAFASKAVLFGHGGDILVLRERGGFAYNSFFIDRRPHSSQRPNSVETIIVDTRDKANSAYVKWAIDHAEMIWLAGGRQSESMHNWNDTKLSKAVDAAIARGVVIGGTSSGMAILGGVVCAPGLRYRGTTSAEAIADPFNERIRIHDALFKIPRLENAILDMHVAQEDRIGRLITFVARAHEKTKPRRAMGIGLDEGTALFIDENGIGHFTANPPSTGAPATDAPPPPWYAAPRQGYILIHDGESRLATLANAKPLQYYNLGLRILKEGDTVDFNQPVRLTHRISVDGTKPEPITMK